MCIAFNFKHFWSTYFLFQKIFSPTNDGADMRSIMLDRKYWVQFPVTLVDLTVRNFPWFSSDIYRLGFLRRTPHRRHSTYSPRSHMWTIRLKPTTNQPKFKTGECKNFRIDLRNFLLIPCFSLLNTVL